MMNIKSLTKDIDENLSKLDKVKILILVRDNIYYLNI